MGNNMWLLKTILLVVLLLYNAIYLALSKVVKAKRPYLKTLAIIGAILLAVIVLDERVITYSRYTYAEISVEGNITRSRNFPYDIRRATHEDRPAYFIIGKYDKDNLTVISHEAVTSELAIATDGVRITFIGVGLGNPIVPAAFRVEIRK